MIISDSHGLHGHVQIFLKNKKTGEKTLHFEKDNVIPISGSQWIFTKMFGLYLDSDHNNSAVLPKADTNLVMPDLNAQNINIGVNPAEYTTMTDDISVNHFVQGFMIGNGGAGEDSITSKNTDYSFINLRNPIPFQQSQSGLSTDKAGKYLGKMRYSVSDFNNSYYIKRFDSRPRIRHSWWKEGQKWDYVDPLVPEDLGPVASNGSPKSPRIESYVECELSISDDDCLSYFAHEGSSETPAINELGLVSFDAVKGQRGILESLYNDQITEFLKLIYDGSRRTAGDKQMVINYATSILETMAANLVDEGGTAISQTNMDNFMATLTTISESSADTINVDSYQAELALETNIEAKEYHSGTQFQYVEDKFLEHLNDQVFSVLTTDEAQRTKLITYYTFNTIPLEQDIDIIFLYRIYAN